MTNARVKVPETALTRSTNGGLSRRRGHGPFTKSKVQRAPRPPPVIYKKCKSDFAISRANKNTTEDKCNGHWKDNEMQWKTTGWNGRQPRRPVCSVPISNKKCSMHCSFSFSLAHSSTKRRDFLTVTSMSRKAACGVRLSATGVAAVCVALVPESGLGRR